MQNLIPFNYQSKEVRTVVRNGEPWFVAKDVCEILELENVARATERLTDSQKGFTSIHTLGGNQDMSVISEAGLYKLVFTSRKPEAEKFTDWLATEVIPAIRKTGTYQIKPMSQIEILQQTINVIAEQDKKINQVQLEISNVEARFSKSIEILTEKVEGAWRDSINARINELCARCGLNYQKFRSELYEELELVAKCNLGVRQKRMKERMEKAGSTYKERHSITKVHIIDADYQLKTIFEGIVNKYVLKYAE